MIVGNIINILRSHPDEKVILTMLTRQDFQSDEDWKEAYHSRSKIDWNNVAQKMIQFSKKFEEHMDYDMPVGSTSSDIISFLNKYFIDNDKVIANVFTIRDFQTIKNGHWVAFASLINDDYPTDDIINFTY